MKALIKQIESNKAKTLIGVVFLAALLIASNPGFVDAWYLSGSCSGIPSSITVGQSVNWSATQTSTMQPSEGHYEWIWSGTDGLSGTTQSVSKTYTTVGTKTGNVRISMVIDSGPYKGLIEYIDRSCSVNVTAPVADFKLVLSDISCQGENAIRVHFVVNQLPSSVNTYGSVTYVLNGVTRTASFVSASASTAHYAEVITGLAGPYNVSSGYVIIDSVRANLDNPQTVTTSCTVPTLNVSCVSNLLSAYTGVPVTFSSSVSGGTGTYSYSWTGTDSLSGNTANVSKTYTSPGTKTATVTVVSGSQTKSASCSTSIVVPPDPELAGSCSVTPSSIYIGQSLNWGAQASGGNGTYSYSWTGTDSLSGNTASVSKTYSTTGTKTGTVTISSGSQSITKTCQATVTTPPPTLQCKLEITKSVDKSIANIGDTLTYTLNFKNIGTADCTGGGVKVKDVVDSNLEFISETHSSEIDPGYNGIPLYTSSTRTLIWDANILNPGETGTITWKGKIKTPSSCGSFEVNNQAHITSLEYSNFSVWVPSNIVYTDVSNSCPPPLQAECEVNPLSTLVGNPVTWNSIVSGGTGTYLFSWTGSDGLFGSTQSLSKTYTTPGTKTGTVTVTSGTETLSRTCETVISSIPVTPPATLKVIKNVINDNGGNKSASDFEIWVKSGSTHIANSPASGSATGLIFTLAPGNYVVGETDPSSLNYNFISITGDCSSAGNITLASGDSKTCTITNNDKPVETPSFSVACAVTPSSAYINENINYSATASGGEGSYTYSWSGTDALSGSSQNVSKTYTSIGSKSATVSVTSGSQTKSATCEVNITEAPVCTGNCGGGGNGGFQASCTPSVSQTNIGQNITWSSSASGGNGTYSYSWSGADGLSGTTQNIDKAYGSPGTKNAIVTVTSGTESATASCSLSILPPPGCTGNCGGGGFNPPKVVLLKKPAPSVLSYVYLSQVPYTGVGDWVKVGVFVLVIALWSAIVAYAIKGPLMKRIYNKKNEGNMATNTDDLYNASEMVIRGEEPPLEYLKQINTMPEKDKPNTSLRAAHAPVNLPTGQVKETSNGMIRGGLVDLVAGEAQMRKAIISEEGIKAIISRAQNDAGESVKILDSVVNKAENLFDREDGWLLLNKEKVVRCLEVESAQDIRHEELVIEHPKRIDFEPIEKRPEHISQALPKIEHILEAKMSEHDAPMFVRWLAVGDKANVFNYLSEMRKRGMSPEKFIKKIILDLDRVYRARKENMGELSDSPLMNTVSGLSDEALENLVEILLSVVDESFYKSMSTGLKLAILRAGEIKRS